MYGCAADRNQAKIVFDVAVDMVRFCPALSKRVKILESQKKLIYKTSEKFNIRESAFDRWIVVYMIL